MKRMLSNIPVFLALAGSVFSPVSVLAASWPNPIDASVVSQLNMSSVQGSGVLQTESRKVSTFTSVDVSGSYDVEIVAQQAPSLIITADNNLLPLIITEVRDDTLFIYNRRNISSRNRLKVKISSKKIEKVSDSGANTMKIFNLSNQRFTIDQSGSGKTQVSGKAKEFYLTLSGTSYVDAKNLKSEKVTIDISGAGNADVFATKELDTSIAGVGNINYYGNPKTITRNIAGVGSINKK